jgi:hypothetical protein
VSQQRLISRGADLMFSAEQYAHKVPNTASIALLLLLQHVLFKCIRHGMQLSSETLLASGRAAACQ